MGNRTNQNKSHLLEPYAASGRKATVRDVARSEIVCSGSLSYRDITQKVDGRTMLAGFCVNENHIPTHIPLGDVRRIIVFENECDGERVLFDAGKPSDKNQRYLEISIQK